VDAEPSPAAKVTDKRRLTLDLLRVGTIDEPAPYVVVECLQHAERQLGSAEHSRRRYAALHLVNRNPELAPFAFAQDEEIIRASGDPAPDASEVGERRAGAALRTRPTPLACCIEPDGSFGLRCVAPGSAS